MKVLIAFIALFGQLLSLIHLAMDRRTDFRNSDFYVSCQPCLFFLQIETQICMHLNGNFYSPAHDIGIIRQNSINGSKIVMNIFLISIDNEVKGAKHVLN